MGQGLASGVILSGGSLIVSSGGTALAVTSNAGATVNVESGGYIEYLTQSQTIEEPVDGETGVWVENKYTDAVLSSGMSIDSITLTSANRLCVYSGGSVGTVMCSNVDGAVLYVYSGGDISVLSVYGKNPSTFEIHSGGVIEDLHISSATNTKVSGGGTINSMTLWSNGVIAENLVISQLTQQTYGGLSARTGVKVLSADISANHFRVASGASAANVTVYSGGNVSVLASGIASGVNVLAGGKLQILSGGTALDVTSNTGATVTVNTGGYIG
jgi:autotransporter passenger strand-loop-strand repeat protein